MPKAKGKKTFTLPDNLPTVSKRTSEPFSDTTIKMYKSKLNKLAEEGFSNINELLANQETVIQIARRNCTSIVDNKVNGEKTAVVDPQKMRAFLSAIFYVLSNVSLDDKVALYNEFQSYKDEPYRKIIKGTSMIEDE